MATRRNTCRALAMLALCSAGCDPPSAGESGAPPRAPLLYVANALDGTVTRLESGGNRVVGAALPAGRAPWQMAVGASGTMLVLAAGASTRNSLTYVAPSVGVWRARSLVLEPGAQQLLLAGDGKRYAAVAYGVADAGAPGVPLRCRLALVDLRTGAISRTYTPCAGEEGVTSLAVDTTAAGTTVYVGISSWYEENGRRQRSKNGQIVALDAETAVPLVTYPAAGWPRSVQLAPGPGGLGRRLYCLVAVPGPNWDGREDEDSWLYASGGELRLLALDPAALTPLDAHALAFMPSSLAVAPDGQSAYALTVMGSQIVHIDLATGATRRLWQFRPTDATDLAVGDKRLYLVRPYDNEVWVLDREHGRVLKTVPVGHHPLGIVAATGDRA
jgi:outer membrane protein assembly factor BamB